MTLSKQDERLLLRALDGLATPAERAMLEARASDDPKLDRAWQDAQRLLQHLNQLPTLVPAADLVAQAWVDYQKPREARRIWPWLLVPVAAGLAILGTWLGFDTAEAPVVLTVARPALPRPALLTARGPVWLTTAAGHHEAMPGAAVGSGDMLATAAAAEATLQLAYASVTLTEHSALQLDELSERLPKVTLNKGVVQITVQEAQPTPVLEVHLNGLKEHVFIQTGAVGIVQPQVGVATVACLTGHVRVVIGTQSLQVEAGQEITLRSAQTPKLGPSAPNLTLVVEALGKPAHDGRLTLRGHTQPGVELRVGSVLVPVATDGSFVYVWRPEPTERTVLLAARDALNRRQQRQASWPAPSRASPKVAPGETEWEWAPKVPG